MKGVHKNIIKLWLYFTTICVAKAHVDQCTLLNSVILLGILHMDVQNYI